MSAVVGRIWAGRELRTDRGKGSQVAVYEYVVRPLPDVVFFVVAHVVTQELFLYTYVPKELVPSSLDFARLANG